MKDFKVFTGVESKHLTEVLYASLKDDTVPEEFLLNNSGSYTKPVRYIRIEPIS
jgi:Muskelin N-terminus